MTGEIPFPNVSLKQLKLMISEDYRPGIPKECPEDLSELLKSCWNVKPDHRPSFELIHNTLCIILSKEEGYRNV